jgi:hypothetical protein
MENGKYEDAIIAAFDLNHDDIALLGQANSKELRVRLNAIKCLEKEGKTGYLLDIISDSDCENTKEAAIVAIGNIICSSESSGVSKEILEICIENKNQTLREKALDIFIEQYKRALEFKLVPSKKVAQEEPIFVSDVPTISQPNKIEKELIQAFGRICRHSHEGNEKIVKIVVEFLLDNAVYALAMESFYSAAYRSEKKHLEELCVSLICDRFGTGNQTYYENLERQLNARYTNYTQLSAKEKRGLGEFMKLNEVGVPTEKARDEYVSKQLFAIKGSLGHHLPNVLAPIIENSENENCVKLSLCALKEMLDDDFLSGGASGIISDILGNPKFSEIKPKLEEIL